MIANKILERISRGEKALGMGMSHPSEELVELAARMGLDFVNFDGQHTPITPPPTTMTRRSAILVHSTIRSFLRGCPAPARYIQILATRQCRDPPKGLLVGG